MRVVKCKRGQSAKFLAIPGFVYCGRKMPGYKGSPLGNPYIVGKDGPLPVVLDLYRKHLWRIYRSSERETLLSMVLQWDDSSVLGCWCVDKEAGTGEEECHCDVLCKFWRWVKTQS